LVSTVDIIRLNRKSLALNTNLLSELFRPISRPAVNDDATGIWTSVRLPVFSETKIDELREVVELVFQDVPERDVVEEVVSETGNLKFFEARTKFQGGEDVLGHVSRGRCGQCDPRNIFG
jgi:hypothetical protein